MTTTPSASNTALAEELRIQSMRESFQSAFAKRWPALPRVTFEIRDGRGVYKNDIVQDHFETWQLALQQKEDSAALEIAALTEEIEALGAENVACEEAIAEKDAEIGRLRAALEPFVRHHAPWMDEHPDDAECTVFSRHTFGDLRKARAALQTEGGKF